MLLEKAESAFQSVDTTYKAKNTIRNHSNFVTPIEVQLSFRREAMFSHRNELENRLVVDKSYYIPLSETIKQIFQDSELINAVVRNVSHTTNGAFSNFSDGSFCKEHELFSDITKTTLRLQIFYDGMGTTNPLRGHSTPHTLGKFYFIIENLPHWYNTCFQNVHVFAVCNTLDIKRHGFHPILRQFVDDLKVLETSFNQT